MARCGKLWERSDLPAEDDHSDQPSLAEVSLPCGEPEPLVCSHCGGGVLILIEETPKPSWREILRPTSESCPAWYADWQRDSDRRFWDGLMGEGFNDWYLETVVRN